jgi:hypothetical protein
MWNPETSSCCEPQWSSLPERFDRLRMNDCGGAHDPADQAWRAQTLGECARSAGRNLLVSYRKHPLLNAQKNQSASVRMICGIDKPAYVPKVSIGPFRENHFL